MGVESVGEICYYRSDKGFIGKGLSFIGVYYGAGVAVGAIF